MNCNDASGNFVQFMASHGEDVEDFSQSYNRKLCLNDIDDISMSKCDPAHDINGQTRRAPHRVTIPIFQESSVDNDSSTTTTSATSSSAEMVSGSVKEIYNQSNSSRPKVDPLAGSGSLDSHNNISPKSNTSPHEPSTLGFSESGYSIDNARIASSTGKPPDFINLHRSAPLKVGQAVRTYTFKNEMKGMMKVERTRKFAAFCLPTPLPKNEISPNGHGHTAVSARLSKPMSREPSRKFDYLRNSLKKLSQMDVYAAVPEPSPASAQSPVRASVTNAGLLRMDSGGEIKSCDMCGECSLKGLSCSSGHFICSDCFGSRVRELCGQAAVLRNNDFSIFCPVPRCGAQPWSSYHVRKLLDGASLQLYIDALVESCRAGSSSTASTSTSVVATSPMCAAPRPESTRISRSRKSTRAPAFTDAAVESPSPTSTDVVSATAAESDELKYLTETMDMLREQLRKLNIVPMEYIPLPEIQAELAVIFEKINNEQPYDEQRMDFLLMCMENNPVYVAEKAEVARLWREEMNTYTEECLQTMRGFVPAHIFESSLQSLTQVDGLTMELAKRLLSKKCLWLTRMRVVDIERTHEVDLMGRFNPIAQNLDIVELAAIFASVPEKFLNDPTGRKAQWRLNLENALREMDKLRKTNSLNGPKARNPCYKKQTVAPFANRNTLKRVEFVQSSLT